MAQVVRDVPAGDQVVVADGNGAARDNSGLIIGVIVLALIVLALIFWHPWRSTGNNTPNVNVSPTQTQQPSNGTQTPSNSGGSTSGSSSGSGGTTTQ